jgi:bacterioferritin-associated ferredoxin
MRLIHKYPWSVKTEASLIDCKRRVKKNLIIILKCIKLETEVENNKYVQGYSKMLMCLCYGVSCNQIKKIVQSGINTIEGVQKECGAGRGCGCCLESLEKIVNKELTKVVELTMNAQEAVEPNNTHSQHSLLR